MEVLINGNSGLPECTVMPGTSSVLSGPAAAEQAGKPVFSRGELQFAPTWIFEYLQEHYPAENGPLPETSWNL